MKEFSLRAELWLPRPSHEVFPFFANARNLILLLDNFALQRAIETQLNPSDAP